MQRQMNDYFMSEASDEEYLAFYRAMERQRIAVEANLLIQARENLKKKFEKYAETAAENTKSVIQEIKNEMHTGIKGNARTTIEDCIEEKLPEYDKLSDS
ncbi:hypothetical protein [Streptococcus suis]